MLLVLGRPGAGCSSLLRVVSNERSIFLDVSGDVRYVKRVTKREEGEKRTKK